MNLRRPDAAPRLSVRARLYLGIVVAQHAALGVYCVARPHMFDAPAYAGLRAALPGVAASDAMPVWGALLTSVAVLAAVAAGVGSEGVARWALLASVLGEGLWLGGYLSSAALGTLASMVGPIVWIGLILRDVTMLQQPLKNPFEVVERRVLEEVGPGGAT